MSHASMSHVHVACHVVVERVENRYNHIHMEGTVSKHSKPEPDAHSSRQIVEEEEQADESGLENLTDGQRRVEIEKRRRAMKDQRDARFHPKCKTLTEQINAANNAHAKYVGLLTAAACESRY